MARSGQFPVIRYGPGPEAENIVKSFTLSGEWMIRRSSTLCWENRTRSTFLPQTEYDPQAPVSIRFREYSGQVRKLKCLSELFMIYQTLWCWGNKGWAHTVRDRIVSCWLQISWSTLALFRLESTKVNILNCCENKMIAIVMLIPFDYYVHARHHHSLWVRRDTSTLFAAWVSVL